MESKHAVKMPGFGRGNNPASHCNLRRGKKEQEENEEPQYGVLPSSINEVSSAPISGVHIGCTFRVGQETARKTLHKTLHRPCAPAGPHAKSLRK